MRTGLKRRHLTLRARAALAAILAVCAAALAGSPEFRIAPSRTEAMLGDPIDVALFAGDPKFNPDRIQGVEFDADAEVWNVTENWARVPPEAAPPGAGPKPLWTARLNPFETGKLSLPKTVVHFRAEDGATLAEENATTATVKVAGVLDPKIAEPKLVGLRPLDLFPRNWRKPLLIALALLALAGAAYAAWAYGRKRKASLAFAPPPEPLLPPGVWALREIERLRALPICQEGPAKDVYSLASEVVRVYLGRRFDFNAIDLTTYECMKSLARRDLDADLGGSINRLLSESDLVKFSKFIPPRERWASLWDDAKKIVLASTPPEELDPSLAAKPQPEPEGAPA